MRDYYHRSISGEEDGDRDDPGPDDCLDGGWSSQAGSGAKTLIPGHPPPAWPRVHKLIHLYSVFHGLFYGAILSCYFTLATTVTV